MGALLLVGLSIILLAPLGGLFLNTSWVELPTQILSPEVLGPLKVTVLTGFSGALFSLFFGLIFAKFFAHFDWRFKSIQRLGILIPYLIPNFVLAMAYVLAWNPSSGLLNSFLSFPLTFYGHWGMILAFGVSHTPLCFLILEEKIKRIDPSLIEASRLSGAGFFKTFFKIEMALLRPALLSALGLSFSLNISAFAIPAWIGAPGRSFALTYHVYETIQLGGVAGINETGPLAFLLLLLAVIPLALGFYLKGSDRKYVLFTGKSSRAPIQANTWSFSFAAFQIYFWITQLIFWIFPILALFLSTLVKPGCLQSSGLSCLGEVTFQKYYYVLFELQETKDAFFNSLFYGFIASLLIVLTGVLALGINSNSPKKLSFSEILFQIPLATPGALIALGLIVTASGQYGINLYNTAWIAVAAYFIKHLSLAFQPLRTGFANISGSLLEASRMSGAGNLSTWKKIVLPLLGPEVLGASFLVFIPIIGELTMSVFLSSPTFKTIGTVLFDLQDYADAPAASAMAMILIVLVLLLNSASKILSRGRLGY